MVTEQETPPRVYFPNLNGIRFIAALMVIVHHVEQFRAWLGIPSMSDVPVIAVIGKLGVALFFVLSGFLITFLLMQEKETFGSINVYDFYLRRVLRIWPLYFLIVAFGFSLNAVAFFSIPELSDVVFRYWWAKLIPHLLMLPNVAAAAFAPIPYASQAWSIGVEEQFYLLWPLLIRWSKRTFWVMLGVVAAYLTVFFAAQSLEGTDRLSVGFRALVGLTRIDLMAIGGLGALALRAKSPLLKPLFNVGFEVLVYSGLITLIMFGVNFGRLHYEMYGLLFAVVIVNAAGNSRTLLRLEHPWISYLGKISYGLYMFHPIAIVTVLKGMRALGWEDRLLSHAASILLTIFIAAVSYRFFEQPFIKRKLLHTRIVSGDQAN